MNRPRAADDFSSIRARIEELRRERAQLLAGADLPAGRTSSVYVRFLRRRFRSL
jgi:hypothetical protein